MFAPLPRLSLLFLPVRLARTVLPADERRNLTLKPLRDLGTAMLGGLHLNWLYPAVNCKTPCCFWLPGTNLSMFYYVCPGFLSLAYLSVFALTFWYRLGARRIWGGRRAYFSLGCSVGCHGKALSSPNDKKHRMILRIILALMLFFYLTECFPPLSFCHCVPPCSHPHRLYQ